LEISLAEKLLGVLLEQQADHVSAISPRAEEGQKPPVLQ